MWLSVEYRFAETSPWSVLQRAAEERNQPVFLELAPKLAGLQFRTSPDGITEVIYDGIRPRGADGAERVYLKFAERIYIGEHTFTLIVPDSVPLLQCSGETTGKANR